ncbi:hypothetical protein LCGC14_0862490 [marine sediment metagenome]|uniref:Uncharacterized protein n=1 Tax=marine sediment metagenome TaxID=412755 RepID=A0A0F9P6X9_9ZZZZ
MGNNLEFKGGSINYNTEETKYPPKIEQKENRCYCCHQVKSGDTVVKNNLKYPHITNDDLRFVCNSCNHLKSKEDRSK